MEANEKNKFMQKVAFPPQFPDWRDPEAYGAYANWSHRRWAWEFLRRNEDYLKVCENFRVVSREGKRTAWWFGPEAEMRRAAALFGRLKLKHYLEPYGEDDEGEHWLAEAIVDWQSTRTKEGESVEHFLVPGQVSLVFDLTQTEVAGTAVIPLFLAHAKRILDAELMQYVERHLKGPALTKAKKDPKLRPKPKECHPERDLQKRLRWLRIYDALKFQKATKLEVIKAFFINVKGNDSDDDESDMTARRSALSRNLIRAREIVGGDYQAFIPLDYIDKKEGAYGAPESI